SPKAILDDAHASPAGRGPTARVNPSLSAIRPINSRRSRSLSRGSHEAGITPARAAPKGRRAQRRLRYLAVRLLHRRGGAAPPIALASMLGFNGGQTHYSL